MFTHSLWNSFSDDTNFPSLQNDIEVDVAIIGGGITGITTAQLLSEAGFTVAVLEERKIGGGTTSHSTGNLYYTIDQVLSSLQSKYDNEVIRKVVSSRFEAMKTIEENVQRFNIDCDYQKVPWYLFSDNEENSEKIEKEFQTALEAGVEMEKAGNEEIPFHSTQAVKVGGQAQFNAMRYVQGLAKNIENEKCQIYENTRVFEIDEEKDTVLLKSTRGNITCKYAVHATHTPKGVRLAYHTVLGPYREYGVAAKLQSGEYPKGIFWGYFNKGDKYSVRSYSRGNENYIIAVGQPHKVGQAKDNEIHIQNLEDFLRKNFEIGEVTHKWGGQHYRPADKLPYIGKKSDGSRIYLATGFSTDGLVYGMLSAMLIRDEIAGKGNPYSEMYKAARFTPLKSAKEFIKENTNVAKELISGLIGGHDEEELKNLNFGEGKIFEKDGHKIAACKTEQGETRLFSAFCTHLGCVVHWNLAEKTWDCPCHGSRFDREGKILEGPALQPLKRIIPE